MKRYIVRDWSNNGKYAINTTDLVAALRKLDELAATNTPRELVQKTKGGPNGNQLQCVSNDAIEAARARM